MKGFLMAAGLGTRLQPYTSSLPKPLFEVLCIPLARWVVAAMKQAGVTAVTVNLHHLPGAITAELDRGGTCGLNVRYSHEEAILGTGGALLRGGAFDSDDDRLLVHNADIFSDWDLDLLASHPELPVLGVVDGPLMAESDRRVELDASGRVTSLRGLPRVLGGRRVVYGGAACVNHVLIDMIRSGRSGWSEGGGVHACLVKDGLIPMLQAGIPVHSVEFSNRWYCDIGTPESYLELNRRALLASGSLPASRGFEVWPEVEPGVRISGSASIGSGVSFCGPVVIGSKASVGAGSKVGPFVSCSGQIEDGSIVRDAVIMAGAAASGFVSGIVVPRLR